MKKLLVAALLSTIMSASVALDMTLPITAVIDGDTIKTTLSLPCPLCSVSIRILGIDTPETGFLAKCPAEKVKGLAAKEYLKKLVGDQKTMTVHNVQWDKYGGRMDANVEINGIDVGKDMLEKGFAKPYTGVGPKPDWCS
jgi:micrococcal nuclease